MTDRLYTIALPALPAAAAALDAFVLAHGGQVREEYPDPPDVWGEDPSFRRETWHLEVANRCTNLGYWAWVAHEREAATWPDGRSEGPPPHDAATATGMYDRDA